ncbi:MAG: UDP-N-acetylmuramoyl-tripeptide--D-alanyl-D-alanine ligase [Chloroflexota bacterium]|nr:UDP-N-acetylmuramoyl-tripeptide--D-alanyl-D-alanine ligase [Chloroflexota bacterium]
MLNLAGLLNALSPHVAVGGNADIDISQVCIDSREAGPRSLFVALHGERTDGHLYVEDAFAAGATVALVEEVTADGATIDTLKGTAPAEVEPPVLVVVPDTLQALQRLAGARRRERPDLCVVGVTGSVGKTTTKETIAAVLAQRYETLKSSGNYNNEIGLPLTLMALKKEHECAVLEMSMYALGEIALLCDIASPQIGVVTNVGPSHLERLGSMERIAEAKAELVRALPADGLAVLNGDDRRVRLMREQTQARVLTFGLHPDSVVWADEVASHGLGGMSFTVHVREASFRERVGAFSPSATSHPLHTSMLGFPGVMSSLAAVAVGIAQGLSWEEIEAGLEAVGPGLRLVPRRGIRHTTLLDDTYNASPESVMAALDLLAGLPGRHLAVLGDMLELGAYEREGHHKVGRYVVDLLDFLVTVGDGGRLIAEGAREAGFDVTRLRAASDNEEALAILEGIIEPGDAILVKGSRSMKMEMIVEGLEQP